MEVLKIIKRKIKEINKERKLLQKCKLRVIYTIEDKARDDEKLLNRIIALEDLAKELKASHKE